MTELISGERRLRIGEGTRVTLHFSILFEDGQEVDGTRKGEAATFDFGDGSLLPGFEAALVGLQAGDARQIELPPDQAFGEHNPGNLRRLPRSQFGADLALELGLIVSFASPEGELPGVVRELDESTVLVDFNHPLAGRSLVFDVAIEAVDTAV